jgi:hypothetical protein
MFQGTDSLFIKHWISFLKYFLQILQKLEFTHAKFLLWSQLKHNVNQVSQLQGVTLAIWLSERFQAHYGNF